MWPKKLRKAIKRLLLAESPEKNKTMRQKASSMSCTSKSFYSQTERIVEKRHSHFLSLDSDSSGFRSSSIASSYRSNSPFEHVHEAFSISAIHHGAEDKEYEGDVLMPQDPVFLEQLDVIKTIELPSWWQKSYAMSEESCDSGTGTFGKVVLAQNTETEEYSALKILSLHDLIRYKQIEHARNEKNILRQLKHPFIISLKCFFKDEYNIYFLMDYACGGELFSYLKRSGKFNTQTCAFYSAEIVSALGYLHSKNIVHRDLKPENLLLDESGHLKLTDFGFAKQLRNRTWTICGTPEYLAPEIILKKGYAQSVDWWALGILIYEMHCGYSPFRYDSKYTTYERILNGKIEWPSKIFNRESSAAKDIIKRLLVADRDKRLGCGKGGVEELKCHKFFRNYDWRDVYLRKLPPPIIPKIAFNGDTSNFGNYPDSWKMKSVTEEQLELFYDF